MQSYGLGRYLGVGVSSASKRQRKQISPAPSTTTLQQLKTKGTITPISDFNAESAARQIHTSLHDVGVDSSVITHVITSHTNKQRQSIRRHYKVMFGKSLESDINKILAGHFRDIYMALLQDSVDYLVENLHTALVSVRPEESLLIELLCNRSNDKLRQIKETYKKKYGRSIELVVKRELTGDLRRLMRALLNNAREESEEVVLDHAHLDAQIMVTSGVGTKYGTDDAAVAALLNQRSYEHLRETFDEYKRLSGQEVEDMIEAQFKGTRRHGLLALVKVVRDPLTFFTERLNDSLKGPRVDDQKLIRLLVTRSEIDLLDIKELYLTLYDVKISYDIADVTSGDYTNVLYKILGIN